MRHAIIGCVVVVVSLTGSASGQSLGFAGSTLWNYIFDTAVVGDCAYGGFAAGIAVIDISDPTNPHWVASCNTPLIYDNDLMGEIAAAGNLAYAIRYPGMNSQDIVVCDISDPLHPSYVGSIATPLYGITALAADPRGYLFYADFERRLVAVDMSNPAAPVEIATVPRTAVCPTACTLAENLIYIIEADSLHIYDVAVPSTPVHLGSAWLGAGIGQVGADHLAVAGGYAYVACVDNGLRVLDVGLPTQPTLVATFAPGGTWFSEVTVVDQVAYCWQGNSGVALIDVTNPEFPQPAGTYFDDVALRSSAGDRAVGLSRQSASQALCILNVQNPFSPFETGRYRARWDCPLFMRVSGSLAYIMYQDGGLKIVDLSQPSRPEHISTIPVLPNLSAPDFALADHYLFYAAGPLMVWDIENPEQPEQLPLTPGSYEGIAVAGNYAYTYHEVSMLDVFDISDPAAPLLLDSVQLINYRGSIPTAVDGNLLYLRGQGFSICDISDPAQPVLMGNYFDPVWPEDTIYQIEPRGSYVAIAYQGCGMQIVNVENPASPSLVSAYHYDTDIMTSVSLASSIAVAGSWNRGIRLLDLSDLANPVELAGTDEYSDSRCVYVNDEIAIAANSCQLAVFHLYPQIAQGTRATVPEMPTLLPNYPNPFNATTTLTYLLGHEAQVQLTIHNLLGQQVAEVADGVESAGRHTVLWNSEDLPSGIYWARLKSGTDTGVIKMVLLR